jgi:hypothetical protein
MSRVRIVVLLSLAGGAAEAIYSNRSLKYSLVSIGILAGAAFYLATAIIKRASRGDGSSPDAPIGKGNGSNTLEVSALGLKEGDRKWFDIDNPSKTSGSEVQGVQVTPVKEEESAPKIPKPSEQQVSQDTLQVSAIGLMDQSGWVDVGSPSNSPGSKLPRTKTPVTAEVKETPKRQVPNMLLVSAMGLKDDNGWCDLGDSPETAPRTSLKKDPVQELKSYQQLTPKVEDATVISEMIQTIGETYLPFLYAKKGELLEMGKRVEDVHPLKFLETVLNNPELKKSMLNIKDNSWKWGGFLNGDKESPGFIDKCKRVDRLGIFEPYITDFCQAVKIDSQKIRSLHAAKKWKKLIAFLVQ